MPYLTVMNLKVMLKLKIKQLTLVEWEKNFRMEFLREKSRE